MGILAHFAPGARGLQEARLHAWTTTPGSSGSRPRSSRSTASWRRRASPSAAATRSSTAPSRTTGPSSSPARRRPTWSTRSPASSAAPPRPTSPTSRTSSTSCPGFDVFCISTLADDAPEGQFSLSRFYPALKNCLKPVRSNTPNMDDLHQVVELGELIAGGKEAYAERPFINHHYCPMVSPLTMDVDSTEAVMWLTERGLPVYTTVVPNAGLTSPMTLMGTPRGRQRRVPRHHRLPADGQGGHAGHLREPADRRRHAHRRLRAGRHRDRHPARRPGAAGALLRRARPAATSASPTRTPTTPSPATRPA